MVAFGNNAIYDFERMRFETAPPSSMLTTLVTPTRQVEWGRPRRQTDPNVVRRPPNILRHTTHRSVDCPSWMAAAQAKDFTSTTPVSPCSPLSIRGLSNPAFAEIPLRKLNALRSSTSSSESCPSASASALSTPTASVAAGPSVPTAHARDYGNHHNDRRSPATSALDIAASLTAINLGRPSDHSHLKSQLASPGSEPRSPHSKRPPASRSSYGIETATGPPPALSTQRSLLQDKSLRPLGSRPSSPPRLQSTSTSTKTGNRSSPRVNTVLKSDKPNTTTTKRRGQHLPLPRRGALANMNGKKTSLANMHSGGSVINGDGERTTTMADGKNTDGSSRASSADESRFKNEDVFLNIARSSANSRESSAKAERRRKFGLSAISSRSSRATEQTPSPEPSKFSSSQTSSFNSLNSSPRYFGVSPSSRSVIGAPRGILSRASRDTSPDSPQTHSDLRPSLHDARAYRPSNLSTIRTNEHPISDAPERARLDVDKSRLDGTDSTLSTTAPSTVWDELDDLKSRIRKLELTGKLPSSSAAAMSNASAERPRTATTTVTTLSSSPKNDRKGTSPSPDLDPGSAANQIQTLLHSALAKVRAVVGAEVYNALEVTATDALTLANILGSMAPPSNSSPTINGTNLSERQAKRKADSLCRSLTELCLALSGERQMSSSKQQRPGSCNANSRASLENGVASDSRTAGISYCRSISHESEDLSPTELSPRFAGRLEARRASMQNLNSETSGSRTPQQETKPPQTNALSTPPTRFSRTSMSLRTKRQAEDDADGKGVNLSGSVPARAPTDVGRLSTSQRFSSRDRLSRGYTPELPQHDQSTLSQQQRPPQPRLPIVAQSSIPLRRSYGSATSYIPATSSFNIQPGFRRYGASPGAVQTVSNHDVSELPVEMTGSSPQQVPPTRIVTPSNKTAASYTTIQQPRVRTNSFGTRRIAIRQRLNANAGNYLQPEASTS